MVICLPFFTSFLHFWTCKDLWMLLWKCYMLSHVWFFVIPWTVTRQAPLCPWTSPGKNTGVGGHSLLQGSSWPRDWTRVSCIAGRFFTWAMSAPRTVKIVLKIKDLFWRKDLVCYEKVMLEQYQQYLPSTHPAPHQLCHHRDSYTTAKADGSVRTTSALSLSFTKCSHIYHTA